MALTLECDFTVAFLALQLNERLRSLWRSPFSSWTEAAVSTGAAWHLRGLTGSPLLTGSEALAKYPWEIPIKTSTSVRGPTLCYSCPQIPDVNATWSSHLFLFSSVKSQLSSGRRCPQGESQSSPRAHISYVTWTWKNSHCSVLPSEVFGCFPAHLLARFWVFTQLSPHFPCPIPCVGSSHPQCPSFLSINFLFFIIHTRSFPQCHGSAETFPSSLRWCIYYCSVHTWITGVGTCLIPSPKTERRDSSAILSPGAPGVLHIMDNKYLAVRSYRNHGLMHSEEWFPFKEWENWDQSASVTSHPELMIDLQIDSVNPLISFCKAALHLSSNLTPNMLVGSDV